MGTADQVIVIHRKAMENQKKALIDKAYKWLIKNVPNYINFEDGFIYEVDMADDLRKYLEE